MGAGPHWSEADILTLERLRMDRVKACDIAKALGRSKAAVYRKAMLLELFKPLDLKLLDEFRLNRPIKMIAADRGMTYREVEWRKAWLRRKGFKFRDQRRKATRYTR